METHAFVEDDEDMTHEHHVPL